MKINPINFLNINKKSGVKYTNLAPLKCDTISFGAMKKSEFEGIDLLVVNQFKAPIQTFKKNKDFQKWWAHHNDLGAT